MKKIFFIFIIVIILSGCSSKSEDKLIVGLIKPSLNHLPFDLGFNDFEIIIPATLQISKISDAN